MDIELEKSAETPFWDNVIALYDKPSERLQVVDYQLDQAIKELRQGNFDSEIMAKIAARVRHRKK